MRSTVQKEIGYTAWHPTPGVRETEGFLRDFDEIIERHIRYINDRKKRGLGNPFDDLRRALYSNEFR
jgi:hypothetical protein